MMLDRLPNAPRHPTPAQLHAFAAYVRVGSQAQAAHECGIALPTLKNHISELYARLDVGGSMEALTKLGWLSLPGSGPAACAWVGSCSRPLGHRGHHGGMRAFVQPHAFSEEATS
jgi:hypothetical protein